MNQFYFRAALALCALDIVFLADHLPAFLVQAILFLLAVLFPAARFSAGPFSRLNVSWLRKPPGKSVLILFSILMQAALFFSDFFFSDDALRHLHEGTAILRGIDVYSSAPLAWPSWLAAVPLNAEHSHIASVYFPFTQMQSTLGAWLWPQRGYILLFHILAAGLASALILISRRRNAAVFLFSPAFIFISSGRHEDLLGATAFLLAMALLRGRGWAWGLFSGFLAGCLLFVKPDGIVLAGLFFLAWRRRGLVPGMLLAAGLLIWFSITFLLASPETIGAFVSNLRLFADSYTGYNPLPLLGAGLWSLARWLIAAAAVLLFLRGWLRGGRERIDAFLWILLASVLLRGVWHPWYFLWISAFLFWRGRPLGTELIAVLSLFYIPVADLRAGNGFHFEKFYVALGIWLLLRAMDKFLTVRKFRRL